MDKEKLVELLNRDLELEFRSIVQYTQHVATVKGMEFQPMAEMIRPHLRQELEHATVLAEQIAFLGGEPTTRVPISSSRNASSAGTGSVSNKRKQWDFRTSPKLCGHCSNRRKTTCGICAARSASESRAISGGLGGARIEQITRQSDARVRGGRF